MDECKEKNLSIRNQTEFSDIDFSVTTYNVTGCIGGANCHDFIEFVYIDEGEVEITVDGNDYMVECGGLLLIKPGERYYIESLSPKVIKTSIKILPERIMGMSSSFRCYKKTVARILDDRNFKRIYTKSEIKGLYIEDLLSECNKEWNEKADGFEFIVKFNIMKIIIWLFRKGAYEKHKDIKNEAKFAVVQRAVNYIDENIGVVTGANVAGYCGISYSYFLRLFKEVTNCNFGKYVQNKRMEEAQRLLMDTQKPITEIAKEVGFSTTSYFIHFFRDVTGLTPRQYRNKN